MRHAGLCVPRRFWLAEGLAVGEAVDITRRVCEDAAAAIAAIADIEHLLASGDCPLTDQRTSKYLLRCKSMATELQGMADQWVVDAVDHTTRRIYDDAETAITAIADIERLLGSGACPLGDRQVSKYLLRCKSMATELQGMADQWAADAETT